MLSGCQPLVNLSWNFEGAVNCGLLHRAWPQSHNVQRDGSPSYNGSKRQPLGCGEVTPA